MPKASRIESFDWWQLTVSPRTSWWFVALTTEDGRAGYGECSDGGTPSEMVATLNAVELVGRDAVSERAEILAQHERNASAPSGPVRHLIATVESAIELALADLATQYEDVPLWRAYASATNVASVELYANINRAAQERSPEGFARTAAQAVAEGFRTIKCAPFDDEPKAAPGLAIVAAIREAIGPDVALLVDCHHRLYFSDILGLLPEFERLKIGWLEDAVPFGRLDELRALKAATTIPLAGGEQVLRLHELEPALTAGALDVVMPDVKHAGLEGTFAIARAARAAGLRFSPHNPAGPIATAASLHVAAAFPTPTLLEFAYGEVPWRGEVVAPAERVHGGSLSVPAGPGLGAALDLAAIR